MIANTMYTESEPCASGLEDGEGISGEKTKTNKQKIISIIWYDDHSIRSYNDL